MFSFFFDGPSSSSSRRSCYLAPERFYSPGSKTDRKRRERESDGGGGWEEGVRNGKVTEAMDVFSAGCVITELWLEGKDVFSLSGMLGWKKGESSPEGVIGEIEDEGIRVGTGADCSSSPS
jgi:phosphoinositide-3-kinase regulatory subunit 4